MIFRLAVILIGQYRTWPVCSKYLQNFFRNKAHQVDYYFVTWDTTQIWKTKYSALKWVKDRIPVKESDIVTYFDSDSNLIKCSVLPDIEHWHSYYRMAYLSREANKLKCQHEQSLGFVYDQVVETRPDIYIRSYADKKAWDSCSDLEYAGSPIYSNDPQNGGPLIMGDLYIRSNSKTNDILSQRIDHCDTLLAGTSPHGQGHHQTLVNYILKNNIQLVNKGHAPGNSPDLIGLDHFDNSTDYSFAMPIRSLDLKNIDLEKLTAKELFEINPY
jgi:hypothetical protein